MRLNNRAHIGTLLGRLRGSLGVTLRDRPTLRRAVALGLIAGVIAATVLVGASLPLRPGSAGRLVFRVWRSVSPEAHGRYYATINEVRIYYETYGKAPSVLVLHGGLGSIMEVATMWRTEPHCSLVPGIAEA